MRLSTTLHDPPLVQPRGVNFAVTVGDHKVRCVITRAALVFLAGHFLLPEDYEPIFNTYGDHIVNAARRKYEETGDARRCLTLNAYDIVTCGPEPILSDETPVRSP
jgi:hypothetical protein